MTSRRQETLTGKLYDDDNEITVVELCRICCVDEELVAQLIAEGILEPVGKLSDSSVLPYSSVRRTRTVVRMQRDLGVNLAGAALALELIERIHALQLRMRG